MEYLNIRGIVEQYLREWEEGFELEMRIVQLQQSGSHKSTIDVGSYQQVKEFIMSLPYERVISTDTISSDVRQVQIEGMPTTYMSKKRIASLDIANMGVRMSLSVEKYLASFDAGDVSLPLIRRKDRISTVLGGIAPIRVDLTVVNDNQYELEVEYVGEHDTVEADDIIKAFNDAYKMLFSLISDSPHIYTSEQAGSVIEFVNRTLLDYSNADTNNLAPLSEVRNKLSYYPFPRPRNLKLEDLRYGGLVGGNITYSVTHKTDGVHRILVIDKSGLWLINPPNTLALIMPTTGIDSPLPSYEGLMLEGELVPMEKRRLNISGVSKAKYLFYVFDCLSLPSLELGPPSTLVQTYDLIARCNAASEWLDLLKEDLVITSSYLDIKLKTHQALTFGDKSTQRPEQFFDIMRYVLTNEPEYETDGLIFTPNVGPYNPHSGSLPLDERVLSKHPDIVKYKPVEKMTIDFMITDVGTNYELYTYNSRTKKMEIFNQYPRVPKSFADRELVTGTIVEIGFNGEESSHLTPVFHRIRGDKNLPNGTDVANATFKDIRNPISDDMLMGRNLRLMRHYHSRVKRMMFEWALEKLAKPTNVLLDLGSGRGGDIGKWRGFDRIIAVEPNAEYITEMKERLITYGMSDKVTIIQAKAQDTDIIAQEMKKSGISQVSCVSAMLSMTFLWETQATLQGLCRTINQFLEKGGLFIYMVMDGDLVSQLFRPAFVTSLAPGQVVNTSSLKDNEMRNIPSSLLIGHDANLNEVDFDGAVIKWLGHRKVHVHINESIVTEQDEYLVRLDDLQQELALLGFNEGERSRCDKEKLMTIGERGFSSLFTYGSFIKDMKPRLPGLGTDLIPLVGGIPILDTLHDTAIGENASQSITADWYTSNTILITSSTIADASNFFHALLKILIPDYLDVGLSGKQEMALNLRLQLSDILNEINPATMHKYYYDTELFEKSKSNSYYGLDNIMRVLSNANEYIGDTLMNIVPVWASSYDLIILKNVDGHLIPYKDTLSGRDFVICLMMTDYHFEPLAEYDSSNEQLITQFEKSGAFVSSYMKRKATYATRR